MSLGCFRFPGRPVALYAATSCEAFRMWGLQRVMYTVDLLLWLQWLFNKAFWEVFRLGVFRGQIYC